MMDKSWKINVNLNPMYFWNIKALKQRLADQQISDQETYKYLLFLLALYLVGGVFSDFTILPVPEPWQVREKSLFISLQVLGLVWCYRQNGGRESKDFIKRLICLLFVFSNRFFTFLTILLVPTLILGTFIAGGYFGWELVIEYATKLSGLDGGIPPELGKLGIIVDTITNIVVSTCFYGLLGRHFKNIEYLPRVI